MIQYQVLKNIAPTILKNRLLRVLFSLNIIFLVFLIITLVLSARYQEKVDLNQSEIEKNQQSLIQLQKLVLDESSKKVIDINQTKVFADFDEVIPFIALLEELFLPIDDEAQISIKSNEDQIFKDRFADYKLNLKVNNVDLFFKAIRQLQDSRFILKMMRFNLIYQPKGDLEENVLSRAEIELRLYLK